MKISSSHQKKILQSKELAREGRVFNTKFQVEKNTIWNREERKRPRALESLRHLFK
jgi:hypothetical protein